MAPMSEMFSLSHHLMAFFCSFAPNMSERFAGLASVNVPLGCLDLCSGVPEIPIAVLFVMVRGEQTMWLSHS